MENNEEKKNEEISENSESINRIITAVTGKEDFDYEDEFIISEEDKERFEIEDEYKEKDEKDEKEDGSYKAMTKQFKKNNAREERIRKRKIAKKKLKDSLTLKETSTVYLLFNGFLSILDFLVNSIAILSFATAVVFCIIFIYQENWIMLLSTTVFISFISFIINRLMN